MDKLKMGGKNKMSQKYKSPWEGMKNDFDIKMEIGLVIIAILYWMFFLYNPT